MILVDTRAHKDEKEKKEANENLLATLSQCLLSRRAAIPMDDEDDGDDWGDDDDWDGGMFLLLNSLLLN